MFEINQDPRMTISEKLLFNILETQKEILTVLKGLNVKQDILHSEEITEPLTNDIDETKGFPCKYCGGVHNKPQMIAVCARKNNKRSDK